MRLGILTQYFPPEIGAPQSRLAELAAAFARRGHEVRVLTALPNYPTGRVHAEYRGRFVVAERRDDVDVIRTWIRPSQSAALVPRLASYLSFVLSSGAVGTTRLPRLDYLLVESPPLFLGAAGVWLARRTHARMIFNVSDLWPASAADLGLVSRAGRAYRMSAALEAWCYRNAWLVSGQSAEIVADVRRRFPDVHAYHLSNGVDADAFHPSRRSTAGRAVLLGERAEDDACVVLYAGLHGLAQGLEVMIDAADALSDEMAVRFVLVGDGPTKAALVERARGRPTVRFLDARPRAAVAELLASADVVVVPLKGHIPGAVPSKLYEAMASGRPVVLAATGEAASIVRDADAGVVVPPGDAPALAEALRALARDPSRRAALGANGRRAAAARYERSAIGARFAEYLERHLAAPRAAAAARSPTIDVPPPQ